MKIITIMLIGFPLAINATAIDSSMLERSADKTILPSPYIVYFIENYGVVNHSYPGAEQKMLPTDNSYSGTPGCYLACYSHGQGIYPIDKNTQVMGQFRVEGSYVGRVCQPKGYGNNNLNNIELFKQLCAQKIGTCKTENCWAAGDTGGWFGIK